METTICLELDLDIKEEGQDENQVGDVPSVYHVYHDPRVLEYLASRGVHRVNMAEAVHT